MLIGILGTVASVCLVMFYIPQVIAMHRSKVLQGFSLPAWISLFVALVCLTVIGVLAGLWSLLAANLLSIAAVMYSIVQIARKGR